MSLRQLRNLHLSFPSEGYNPAYQLDDEDFERLISSWSKLWTVTLTSRGPKAYNDECQPLYTPRLTLRSLVSYARHCLNLNSASVSLDASEDVGIARKQLVFPRLRWLGFEDSWITRETVGSVMAFLASLCVPENCSFDYRRPEDGPEEEDMERIEQWEGVVDGVGNWRRQWSWLLQCAQEKRAAAKRLKGSEENMNKVSTSGQNMICCIRRAIDVVYIYVDRQDRQRDSSSGRRVQPLGLSWAGRGYPLLSLYQGRRSTVRELSAHPYNRP